MERVFINYRGEDSHSYAALLHLELGRLFGPDEVFLDSASIPAGADFAAELIRRVRGARVVVAVIGRRWLTATDPAGVRRIDRPEDWIRWELAEAFDAGVPVVPVLTDAAELPLEAQLPPELAALARCQYRRLRHREASTDVARLAHDLEALDDGLAVAGRRSRGTPRQLPLAPAPFTGRERELADLSAALAPGSGPAIAVLSGPGGIGKTWLALHWAHQHVDGYPDGQLYADLHGYDPTGERVAPELALRGFLTALSVDPAVVPPDLDAQAALYRSLVADRRLLVVLDNAADTTQVVPLLPAGPSSVLITTRRPRLGLVVTHAARPVALGLLDPAESLDLWRRHRGPGQTADDPGAVGHLVTAAAGLPLALALLAARAAGQPDLPLDLLADEVRDESTRLDALDTGELDLGLRATLTASYRALDEEAPVLFGRLGLAPGPDIGVAAATTLSGLPAVRTAALLRELEAAQLITQHAPRRYRMHDLVRLYAGELGRALPGAETDAALHRTVEHYLGAASAAGRVLEPRNEPIEDGPVVEPSGDEATAWAWFDAEHRCLLAAQQLAVSRGWDDMAWRLAWTLDTYHYRRCLLAEDLAVWQAAAVAAGRIDDPAVRNLVGRHLGEAYVLAGRSEEALQHLHQALRIAEEAGDAHGQAHTHRALWRARSQRGEHRLALDHAARALPLYLTMDKPVWTAETLNQLASGHARLGEYDRAEARCREALRLCRRHGHPDGEARTLVTLGYVARHTGRHPVAIRHYRRALALHRRLANGYEEAGALEQLGHAASGAGRARQASAAWRSAAELYRSQGRRTDADRVERLLAAP